MCCISVQPSRAAFRFAGNIPIEHNDVVANVLAGITDPSKSSGFNTDKQTAAPDLVAQSSCSGRLAASGNHSSG
jgi:hypothetical protein